jgi:sugar phosphate isomerase/epimerase
VQLGVFARTFSRPNFEAAFDAAKGYGLACVQFNFTCAGLPTLPELIDSDLARRIESGLKSRSLSMAAISGTCNLIHPQPTHRAQHLHRLKTMIAACDKLGTTIVTLCTGTRDIDDMWRPHADNHSPEARRDLRTSLDELLPIAEAHQVILGIEPEPANVIDTAQSARQLLDEMKSPAIKIIFDAANLVAALDLSQQRRILSEACDLLGSDVVLAHAKDLTEASDGKGGSHWTTVAAGQGELDYPYYLSLLQKAGFDGPLILHSLREDEVPTAVKFLQSKLR